MNKKDALIDKPARSAAGKEIKKEETKLDSLWGDYKYEEFFENKLRLPQSLKDEIQSQGLDYRFINKSQFLKAGNRHRSHWYPYDASQHKPVSGFTQVSPDGLIARGDLVLAVRPKQISADHKKMVNKRNQVNKGYNKAKADEMRSMARSQGLKSVRVTEGYEEN